MQAGLHRQTTCKNSLLAFHELEGQGDPSKPQNQGWDLPSSFAGILLFMLPEGLTQNSPGHLPFYLLAH